LPAESETFRELADNAPVLLWRSRPDKARDYFNKPWLDFTGRTLAEESGFGWAEGVHGDDRERCLATYSGAFDERRSFTTEYRLRRHDGVHRWVLDSGRPYFRDGAFGGYVGSCVDVTDRRRAAEQAGEALAEQQRLLDEKEMLLAELHHRVRNSLQNTLSLISLSRRQTPPEHRPALDSLERSVRAMALGQSAALDLSTVGTVDLEQYLRNLVQVLEEHAGLSLSLTASGPRKQLPNERAAAAGAAITEYLAERRRGLGEEAAAPARIELSDGWLRVSDPAPAAPPQALAMAEVQARQAGAELVFEPRGIALKFER
jgi:PAS domain S-box-containing protein